MAPPRLPIPPLEELVKLAAKYTSVAALARSLEVKPGTLTSRLRSEDPDGLVTAALRKPKDEPEPAGKRDNGDGSATVFTDPRTTPPAPWKPRPLLEAHGLHPDEWEIVRARGNRWGDPGEPLHQLRVDVVPVNGLVKIPDPHKWSPPPKPKKRKAEDYLDAVVISDHHAPHHEPTFHRLFLEYLADEQPGLIEVNGDLLDFSTISRHREREAYAQPVNECLQAGFEILADYRSVCPDAKIRFKRGNHSERLRNLLMDNARELHNIAAAGEEIPALSLRRLLRLDELHIEYVDVEWDQAKTKLSRKLTARHGFSTSKNAGQQMLDKLAGSTIQGHDHRLGMTFRTEHTDDPDDPIRVRLAMQGGCACIIPGGLGYVTGGEPDWCNAFGAFRIWPDGDFHPAAGIYVPGRLLAPNGRRYLA